MAATAPPLRSVERERLSTTPERKGQGIAAVSALTILAVAVHGYHPYAEDGGLYLAGVKRVLQPDLYAYGAGFTTAHLRFSMFAPLVAWAVRASHLSLMTVMLLLYVGSIWATLLAAWSLAVRVYSKAEARYGAVSLLGLLLTVPVAGTSLILMDPYVSARSLCTPCSLFALVAMIDIARQARGQERISPGPVVLCLGCLFVAMLVHPLMGGYALACVSVLGMTSLLGVRAQRGAWVGLCVFAAATGLLILRFAPSPPPGYVEVARTRTYWFVSQWQWYEVAGLIAPLLVLAAVRFRSKNLSSDALRSLAQTGLIAGGVGIVTALLFARVGLPNYAVARLQPLRVFQIIYILTIFCAGAAMGEVVCKRRVWRWGAMIAGVAIGMLNVQLATFPDSAHIEWPWAAPSNPWEQAFTWARNNTQKSAVFALDADYINARGEDAQNFRAIAERGVVPDYSKDGGIASIAPDLTAEWIAGTTAQRGLDQATDAERLWRLRGFPVLWIVLSRDARTGFRCDYKNALVKVCRMPVN